MMALLRLESKRPKGAKSRLSCLRHPVYGSTPLGLGRDCEPASRQVKLDPQTEAKAHRRSTNFGAWKLAEASNVVLLKQIVVILHRSLHQPHQMQDGWNGSGRHSGRQGGARCMIEQR
jgi:hypothetical protein